MTRRAALHDVTGINATAVERIVGLGDGEINFSTWFNDLGAANRAGATGSSFLTLSAQPTTDVYAMYCRGSTLSAPAAGIQAITGGVGAGGCVKRSTDGGVTWTQMTTGGITGITHMEYWKAPSGVVYLYAVAGDGSVIRYVDNSLVGIDPNNQTVPHSFALEQNYPNPFNPSTTIKYSVPQSGNVTIKVYNSLGEVVRTVVDNYHTTGNYVESVDMDGMSSGIYYYTMLGGDFKDTKRMVLVK